MVTTSYISGRRRFDPGIDQRVPFISDPWAEFEGTRSDGDSVLQTWVQMPAPQMTLGFQMVPQMPVPASLGSIICIIACLFSKKIVMHEKKKKS